MRRAGRLRNCAAIGFVVALVAAVTLLAVGLLPPPSSPATRFTPYWGEQETFGNGTVEVNLLNGNLSIAPDLSYQGAYNTTNSSWPVLLTGNATHEFWPSSQPVLELAPAVSSYLYAHSTGMIEFPAGNGSAWEIGTVAASYPLPKGDGVTSYFMLDPTNHSSWNSDYYLINPEGPYVSTPVCSGAEIFPYSASPYVAVQWDPSYINAYCGTGLSGSFNIYLVTPGPGGVVSAANLTSIGPVGSAIGPAPQPGDWFATNVQYNDTTNALNATAIDENDPSIEYTLNSNLSQFGFAPAPELLGAANLTINAIAEGTANTVNWGLLYAAEYPEAGWTAPPHAPPTNSTGNSTSTTTGGGGAGSGLIGGGVDWALVALVGGGAGAVALAGTVAWKSRSIRPPSLQT